jgi:farnesyl diphosphate synthase
MSDTSFTRALTARAAEIETYLEQVLGSVALPGETMRPERLMAAIRHGVLNGGKRFRPFLVLETARLFGAAEGQGVTGRRRAGMRALLFPDP